MQISLNSRLLKVSILKIIIWRTAVILKSKNRSISCRRTGKPYLKRIGRQSSWILKITVLTAMHLRDMLRIIMPSFAMIGHTVAEISQFYSPF